MSQYRIREPIVIVEIDCDSGAFGARNTPERFFCAFEARYDFPSTWGNASMHCLRVDCQPGNKLNIWKVRHSVCDQRLETAFPAFAKPMAHCISQDATVILEGN